MSGTWRVIPRANVEVVEVSPGAWSATGVGNPGTLYGCVQATSSGVARTGGYTTSGGNFLIPPGTWRYSADGNNLVTLDPGTGGEQTVDATSGLPAGFTVLSATVTATGTRLVNGASGTDTIQAVQDNQTTGSPATLSSSTWTLSSSVPSPSALDLTMAFGIEFVLGTAGVVNGGIDNGIAYANSIDIDRLWLSGSYDLLSVSGPVWWCNDELCVYATGAPDTDYVQTTLTGSDGWWLSSEGFAGAASVVHNSRPKAPRQWSKLTTFVTGAASMLGGSPAAACMVQRRQLYYPENGYTGGTDAPIIRVFAGSSDAPVGKVPADASLAPAKAVLSMLTANDTIYYSTVDVTGGRVFELNPLTGESTLIGAAFAQVPYALCWHMGRLWVGTNNGNATAGKTYWIRPGIDAAWTQDRDHTTDSLGGVCAMASYKGKLYVGTDGPSGTYAKVLVRDTTGAWTGSKTGTGGTGAKIQNGFLVLTEWSGSLFAGYWNPETTPVQRVESFDGSTWTNVFNLVQSGASGARPPLGLYEASGALLMLGGRSNLTPSLWRTTTGLTGSWTDVTAFIPDATVAAVPMFGRVSE